MTVLRAALALAAALAAPSARAQHSNHGIAVESGIYAPFTGSSGAAPALAVSASRWLDGDLHLVARVAVASVPATAVRGAVPALSGTLGLRLSIGRAGTRPQLLADVGWARVESEGAVRDRATLGVGGGLEWFPASDLSVGARAMLRLTGGLAAADAVVALGAYF
jgi:hypothetical protein